MVFGTLRPFFLGVSSLLLVAGFFLARRKEMECAADGTCAKEARTGSFRFRRYGVLATAAMMVALIGFFPEYGARLVAEEAWAVTGAGVGDYTRLTFDVDGMSCESCAVHVAKAASSVDGVVGAEVDLAAGKAFVVLRASAGDLSRFIADRIRDKGFAACISASK